jgi:hypothetical protein
MQIIFSNIYQKDKNKLIAKNHLLEDKITQTEELVQKEITNPKLRLHKINCKKDKNRYSITIINTQYRILVTICDNIATFYRLLDHNKYDRYNKNC